MKQPIPFAHLREFLLGLGCRFHAEPGRYVAFRHPESKALIMLRAYQDDEALSPTDLAIAGHVLDNFGVMERETFEAKLGETIQAS